MMPDATAEAARSLGLLVATAAVPSLRPLLDDARVRRLEPGGVAYHGLVRIPLGTVLLEELGFRGALLGALARVTSRTRAAAVSSVVFGLWHIRPTLGLLDANGITDGPARACFLSAAVVFTTAAGFLFCFLRVRSGSMVAPILSHIATNSFGLLASVATR